MIISAAVACAACGSSGGSPPPAATRQPRTPAPATAGAPGPARVASPQPEPSPVSFTAAYSDPCLLITMQEAQAILGRPSPPQNQGKLCFIDLPPASSVSFALIAASYSVAGVTKNIPQGAPVTGLGPAHPALCGTSTPSGGASDIQLEAAASPDYTLAVIGSLPCALDADLAKTVLGNLVGG
jgi:hypothetical protein